VCFHGATRSPDIHRVASSRLPYGNELFCSRDYPTTQRQVQDPVQSRSNSETIFFKFVKNAFFRQIPIRTFGLLGGQRDNHYRHILYACVSGFHRMFRA
jgi:hypothetical protein